MSRGVGRDGPPRAITPGGALYRIVVRSEVTPLGPAPAPTADGPRRVPFSLLFHGPPTPILPQRIYPVDHGAIGAFELFLVPLGPDRVGMRYEAVFG